MEEKELKLILLKMVKSFYASVDTNEENDGFWHYHLNESFAKRADSLLRSMRSILES
jgi:hypothetical protein